MLTDEVLAQWPNVDVTLLADATGSVNVAGNPTMLSADSLAAARREALNVVAAVARTLQRESLIARVDDPETSCLIRINTQGQVLDTAAFSATKRKRSRPQVAGSIAQSPQEASPLPVAPATEKSKQGGTKVGTTAELGDHSTLPSVPPVASPSPVASAQTERAPVKAAALTRSKQVDQRAATLSYARALSHANPDGYVARIEGRYVNGDLDAAEWVSELKQHAQWLLGTQEQRLATSAAAKGSRV